MARSVYVRVCVFFVCVCAFVCMCLHMCQRKRTFLALVQERKQRASSSIQLACESTSARANILLRALFKYPPLQTHQLNTG